MTTTPDMPSLPELSATNYKLAIEGDCYGNDDRVLFEPGYSAEDMYAYARRAIESRAIGGAEPPEGWKLLKNTTHAERSWPEDASHENGAYSNACLVCLRMFVGHKRRGVCRVCHEIPTDRAPEPSVVPLSNEQILALVHGFEVQQIRGASRDECCDSARAELAAPAHQSPALRPEPEAAGQDPVVGHKTFRDGPLGFRHAPLRQSEADAIMASVRAADARRVELMPDEQAAIRMMFEAHQRLIELGWRDAIYCPKDGREFDVIEPGSTGIHRCHYSGEWPTGSWWVTDADDMYPSRPVLFRLPPPSALLPEPPQAAPCSRSDRSDDEGGQG